MPRACALAIVLLVACDKPSSHPDPASGGGAASGAGASGASASAGEDGAAEGGAGEGGSTPTPVTRTPVVAKEHEFFGRFEGEGFANDCKTDTACKTGGCSGEVCTAEDGVITTCDVVPVQLPADASCGCVEAQCIWWSPSGATLPPPSGGTSPTKPTPNSGEAPGGSTTACGKATCKPGQTCVGYYGIAGPQGPKFESCEWVCDKNQPCPKGTKCVTVADGPGRVCR